MGDLPGEVRDLSSERLVHDGDAGRAVGQEVRIVVGGEERREGDGDGADLDRAKEHRDEVGRVREEERDALLGLEAQGAQRVAGAVRRSRDVRVREGRALKADCGTVSATGIQMRVDERAREVERRYRHFRPFSLSGTTRPTPATSGSTSAMYWRRASSLVRRLRPHSM